MNFNRRVGMKLAAGLALANVPAWQLDAAQNAQRKFTMDLCPGRVGVNVDQSEAIQLAGRFGFESVEPFATYLAGLSKGELDAVNAELAERKLVWGASGLTVDFRNGEAKFREGLAELPSIAKGLQEAGVTRVGTWITPAHQELTYRANFALHVARLREIAKVYEQSGLRLGLEYVGPRTSWAGRRYAFIHTLVETLELIDAIGRENVGLVLDSWHWYTAEEDVAALSSLSNSQVVAVDLNDAPAGLDVREQIDNRRELPVATGVIDVVAFLNILLKIGYDGPVRAEPFNQPLNALDDAPAIEATAAAMKKAFALID